MLERYYLFNPKSLELSLFFFLFESIYDHYLLAMIEASLPEECQTWFYRFLRWNLF